ASAYRWFPTFDLLIWRPAVKAHLWFRSSTTCSIVTRAWDASCRTSAALQTSRQFRLARAHGKSWRLIQGQETWSLTPSWSGFTANRSTAMEKLAALVEFWKMCWHPFFANVSFIGSLPRPPGVRSSAENSPRLSLSAVDALRSQTSWQQQLR